MVLYENARADTINTIRGKLRIKIWETEKKEEKKKKQDKNKLNVYVYK